MIRTVRLTFPNVSAITDSKHSFNSLTLDQKILTSIIIEVTDFCVAAFIAFSQVLAIGNEVKQMASVTLLLYFAIEQVQSQSQSKYLNTLTTVFSAVQMDGHDEASKLFPCAQSDYIKGEKSFLQKGFTAVYC